MDNSAIKKDIFVDNVHSNPKGMSYLVTNLLDFQGLSTHIYFQGQFIQSG